MELALNKIALQSKTSSWEAKMDLLLMKSLFISAGRGLLGGMGTGACLFGVIYLLYNLSLQFTVSVDAVIVIAIGALLIFLSKKINDLRSELTGLEY